MFGKKHEDEIIEDMVDEKYPMPKIGCVSESYVEERGSYKQGLLDGIKREKLKREW